MPNGPPREPLESLIVLNRALVIHQLLRGFGHDLRNNLQVVSLGSTGLGGDRALEGRVEGALEAMTASLDRLSRLLRPAGEDEPATDLASGFRELGVLSELQRSPPPTRLVIEPPTKGITVLVPRDELLQMLLNLVANAREASRAEDLVSVQAAIGSGRVELRIDDQGSGMMEAAGQLYFTTKDRSIHAGVGLAVTRALAERRGGHLTWRPRTNRPGTRVILDLPATVRD